MGLLWLDITAEDIAAAAVWPKIVPCPAQIAADRQFGHGERFSQHVGMRQVSIYDRDAGWIARLDGGTELQDFTHAFDHNQAVYPTRIKLRVA